MRGAALRVLSRLGPFSPLVTLTTFSPGARALLADAERAGELALHGVRAVLWAVLSLGVVAWSGSAAAAFVSILVLTVVWIAALVGLRRTPPLRWLRYALIGFDAWIIVRSVFVAHGPLTHEAVTVDLLAAQLSIGDIQAGVPPLLVFLALSGALRLDPRLASFSLAVSLAGYAYYAASFAIPQTQALFVGGVILLAGMVGVNAARVLRFMVLKAREEAVLKQYVPRSLSREVTRSGSATTAARVQPVTLLVCDIRGFTPLSERLTPEETVALVNGYLAVVGPPISERGGIVDKYMGDGVLAFFEGADHASRALDAAREMHAASSRANVDRPVPLRIGVALHTGEVLLGSIGTPDRREYTVISDAVNVVSRLEELNKTYRSAIVASSATLDAVTFAERAGFTPAEDVALRGRTGTVAVSYLRLD